MILKLILSIMVLSAIEVHTKDSPVVSLPDGQIVGLEVSTFRKHVKYYAYMGIPYAAPPIGELRFEPPQPAKQWSGIRQVKSFLYMCYQTGTRNKYETEDCLYINVFTPALPVDRSNLTVIVDIYGGVFLRGTASKGYGKPQFLIEAGVIVVNFNYRIGPFGFLSTMDTAIPGNMGLKDQVLALKWVRDNIQFFGGDPNKVTIMGQSAGAASVTYQVLSEKSAGLFRAAIASSSSALCTWAHQRHPLDTAYGIANLLDETFTRDNTTQELKALLKSVDAKAIATTDNRFKSFAPVIEVDYDEAFITESMYEKVRKGSFNRVPLLIGHTSEESLAMASNMQGTTQYALRFDRSPSLLLDENMGITDTDIAAEVGQKIHRIYVNDSTFTDEIGKTIQYMSDERYIRGVQRYAELQSQYSDVYFYQFSYHGPLGNNPVTVDGIGKVTHGEDVRYFWTYINSFLPYPKIDEITVDRYVGLFTNFAKYLNPTPANQSIFQNKIWPKMTPDDFVYLDIDENLTIRRNPREFSYRKMVDLYETYGKKPFVTF